MYSDFFPSLIRWWLIKMIGSDIELSLLETPLDRHVISETQDNKRRNCPIIPLFIPCRRSTSKGFDFIPMVADQQVAALTKQNDHNIYITQRADCIEHNPKQDRVKYLK